MDYQLQGKFKQVVLIAGAILALLFVCAGIVEWIRSASAPFEGLADFEWIQGVRNFLYLMTMFNILLIRYAVMRIYAAPGHIDFATITGRLRHAGIVAVLISALPCLYGLVLFLLAGDPIDFYLLFGLSLLYFVINFPRQSNWVSILEENLGKKEQACSAT